MRHYSLCRAVESVRMRTRTASQASPTQPRRLLAYVGVTGLMLLCFSGYIKGSTLLEPLLVVDPTLVGLVLTLLSLAACVLGQPWRPPSHVGLLLLTAVAFGLGFHTTDLNEYSTTKMVQIATLVPLIVLAGSYLVASEVAKRAWLAATVLLAYGMALLIRIDASVDVFGRIGAEGTNFISASRALGAGAVVLVVLAVRGHRRNWSGLAALPLIAMMFGVQSRGPLLAFVVALVASATIVSGRGRALRAAITFVVVLVVGVVAFNRGALGSRLISLQDVSATSREALWTRAFELMGTHPFGIGWGNLYNNLDSDSSLGMGYGVYPHNILAEVGSEAGWLALLLFVALCVVAARRLSRQQDTVGLALFGLLVFYFVSALTSSDVPSNRGLWVTIGIALAAELRQATKARHSTTSTRPVGTSQTSPPAHDPATSAV
jgi:hypothetical protein